MKKALLVLAILFGALASCDRSEAPATASKSDDNMVMIAPRIQRGASVTPAIWNTTAIVEAALYDENHALIPGMYTSANFGTHTLTLPAVDGNRKVSIYVYGMDNTGATIWDGSTATKAAKQFSSGVGLNTPTIEVYPTAGNIQNPGSAIVGSWVMSRTSYYDALGGILPNSTGAYKASQIELFLAVRADGTYESNIFGTVAVYGGSTTVMSGEYENGTWTATATTLTALPLVHKVCNVGLGASTDCFVYPPGYNISSYTDTASGPSVPYTWSISGTTLTLIDSEGAIQFEQYR